MQENQNNHRRLLGLSGESESKKGLYRQVCRCINLSLPHPLFLLAPTQPALATKLTKISPSSELRCSLISSGPLIFVQFFLLWVFHLFLSSQPCEGIKVGTNTVQCTMRITVIFFLFFLWLHLQHMEVPGLGVKLELQLRPTSQSQQHRIQAASVTYTTATAMPDPLPTKRGQGSNPHGHSVGFLTY